MEVALSNGNYLSVDLHHHSIYLGSTDTELVYHLQVLLLLDGVDGIEVI